MNNYDVCIFDLDGTLVNSLADLADCVNDALSLHSLPTHTLKEYRQFIGHGIANLIKCAMGDKASDEKLHTSVYRAFVMLYEARCLNNTRPYAGVSDLLDTLKQNNVKRCVLSNKADAFTNRIVSSLFGKDAFDLIWGKRDRYPNKPSPDSMNAMIDKLGCPRKRCLYIGDSNVDVETAGNAGVDFCGVEWGFRDRHELIDSGARVVVKKPNEIAPLVLG